MRVQFSYFVIESITQKYEHLHICVLYQITLQIEFQLLCYSIWVSFPKNIHNQSKSLEPNVTPRWPLLWFDFGNKKKHDSTKICLLSFE